MAESITETCSCGASITVPYVALGSLQGWRDGHRHEPQQADPGPAGASPPAVDTKHASALERRDGGRRVGFTVDPLPGSEPWW